MLLQLNQAGFFGGWELILIFAAVLLLFGGRKIPELMRGIGRGVREFNSAKDQVKESLEEGMKVEKEKEGKAAEKEEKE